MNPLHLSRPRSHRAAGRRWHDSVSVGEAMRPAYNPQLVIITENKDTAVGFPPAHGGISVEGSGTGGRTRPRSAGSGTAR